MQSGEIRGKGNAVERLFQAVASADMCRLPVDVRLPDFVIFRSLSRFLMSRDKMQVYGYPLPDTDSRDEGKVLIPAGIYPTTKNYFNSNQRTCSRCKQVFQVREDGTPVVWKRCHYHRTSLLKRQPGSGLQQYACCRRPISSLGCKVSDSHVVDGSGHPDYDRHFRQTVHRTGCPAVYALDCEMCNTTIGKEVTKVTLVNWRFEVVFESLVRPDNPVLDYNTEFSGLRAGDLDHVTTTLTDVQNRLLQLVCADSILIGHALRNDLKALKLLHLKVVDTEEVFADVRGLPFTRSLKSIVQEKFDVQIQQFDHDSKQDAIACMNLMLRHVLPELRDYENAMHALAQFC